MSQSIILPASVVEWVLAGDKAREVRVAVNTIDATDDDWNALVMAMNGHAVVPLLNALACAINHAPDPDTKEAWRTLTLRITTAMAEGLPRAARNPRRAD